MKYRTLDPNGDYSLGAAGQFLIDSPEAVAQAVLTRLRLWSGEWFLNKNEGTPYMSQILGYGTQGTRDLAIKERIMGTPGALELLSYSSSVSPSRRMSVVCRISTIYGEASINLDL